MYEVIYHYGCCSTGLELTVCMMVMYSNANINTAVYNWTENQIVLGITCLYTKKITLV